MNLAKISIKRPTFIISLLMIVLILGVISLSKLSVRMFPDVEFPYVLVMSIYPGAGVAEIEQLVTKPIEDAVSGVAGMKHIHSVNQDNVSIVFGEFELSKNPDIAAQEVRDKVSQIRLSLPCDVKEPIIMKADINSKPIVTLSLKASENMSSKQLYDFADDVVSKDFSQVSGVSEVKIVGGLKREIHINADKKKLQDYELTLSSLAAKIKSNSLNIPAGKVNRGIQEISFRSIGEFESVQQINSVVVSFIGNDMPVTVREVAEVEDGVETEVSKARIHTKKDNKIISGPALLLQIYRKAKGNDIAVSDAIKQKMAEVNEKYKQQYSSKPQLMIISDVAHGIRMNIDDLKFTIFEGIFLAIVVVYFFLGSWRSTFITALSIPNSLIGSFIFMYIAGFSLNVLSLMSLSLVVGLLIDDAIVVRENIFRHYKEGSSPVKAAIDGTNEVALAVIATTSVIIAVFFPVAFLSGIMGQFFREFGLTVVFAMSISILDALTIAPMLSAYIIPEHNNIVAKKWKIQEVVIKFFRSVTVDLFNSVFSFIEMLYKKMISFIVKKKLMNIKLKGKTHIVVSCKFAILFIALFVFIGTILIGRKYLKTTFMPTSEWGEFNVNIQAKPGTSLEQMDVYTKLIEEIIVNDPNIELVSTSVGSSGMFTNLSSQANVYVKMIPARSHVGLFGRKHGTTGLLKRTCTSSEMKDYFRKIFEKRFGNILEFSIIKESAVGHNQSEFEMELSGDEIEILYDMANILIEKFKTIPNFVDIHSNYKSGKPEVQIQMISKNMENFGASSVIVGNEIRAMIDGVEAGKYRDNGIEYDIKVRLQENQRDIIKKLDSIYVNNINNKLIKLKNIASFKNTVGHAQVFRKDRARFITIEGNLSRGGTIGEIQKKVLKIFNDTKYDPKNLEKWKNINYAFAGNAEDMATMFKSIIIAGILSVVLIFIVLASLYESIIMPFTIMVALPLAIIGAIFALLISNQPVDIFTMIGMIMLLGIVAKNSILLVDYIQQQMHAGLSVTDSIIKAGVVRLRPILMTSFAIIAGMLPIALGLSEVGQFRKGMGIVVIGGVISSTILTLIVIPALFDYMNKFRFFMRKMIGMSEKRMIDCTEEELKKKDL
jgi:HAE1 family hydrophobic/amphiphilic exporter-1